MGFPWAVDEHYGNLEEMIAHVDVAPEVASGVQLPWDENTWAPLLDSAISVDSTIFFDQPRLRMPAQTKRVDIYTTKPPPKVGYIYVQKDANADFASHITVLSECDGVLGRLESTHFSEIEGTPCISCSMESLIHQLAWPPTVYSERPLVINHAVLITEDDAVAEAYSGTLLPKRILVSRFACSADIGAADGASRLEEEMDRLNLPKVLDVVHAAGVLESQLALETTDDSFHRVLSLKISGSLVLDALCPPNTLDFFILFSSCGQLFGFPGQAPYASGNAFLDALATNRRLKGDNSVAFQWTCWQHLGMAVGSDFISAELEIKGITDITRDEGFRARQHVDNYDVDRAVVVRSRAFAENETLPFPMLTDIAVRKALDASITNETMPPATSGEARPKSEPELNSWLDKRIRECVVRVLHLTNIGKVGARTPFSEIGIDSVITVTLRKQLQKSIGVEVPLTLTWSHPTVGHLVRWFAEKMVSENEAI